MPSQSVCVDSASLPMIPYLQITPKSRSQANKQGAQRTLFAEGGFLCVCYAYTAHSKWECYG